jgi:hypothetical protein
MEDKSVDGRIYQTRFDRCRIRSCRKDTCSSEYGPVVGSCEK